MNWRGSTDFKDRFFGALVYALPLIYVLPYGFDVLKKVPVLKIVYIILSPVINIYNTVQSTLPFAGLIIFILLFSGVVNNPRISHFIRFNTMQAILLDILVILFDIILSFVFGGFNGGLIIATFSNIVFLGIFIASVYSIIQSALGSYAELPTISEAAYARVR